MLCTAAHCEYWLIWSVVEESWLQSRWCESSSLMFVTGALNSRFAWFFSGWCLDKRVLPQKAGEAVISACRATRKAFSCHIYSCKSTNPRYSDIFRAIRKPFNLSSTLSNSTFHRASKCMGSVICIWLDHLCSHISQNLESSSRPFHYWHRHSIDLTHLAGWCVYLQPWISTILIPLIPGAIYFAWVILKVSYLLQRPRFSII